MSDKLKKWSVLSYVAAVLHAIVLVLLVIESRCISAYFKFHLAVFDY